MKKLFLLLLMVATVGVAIAQTRTVSGTVAYAGDGEPLIGATVMPIGGGQGASTNADGKFNIKVPANVKKIRVSYVGMITKEVAVGTDLKIMMDHTDKSLDEVMVVAYGTATRSAFTGSAKTIDAEQIQLSGSTNALNAMNGRIPGIQIRNNSGAPGSSPSTMLVRGISSIAAGVSPLVVVDGVIFDGDVSLINPADIETMSLQKDAAANALYGARGANGVIQITTKKGVGTGVRVNLDAKWGLNTKGSIDHARINDPRLYYETYYKALNNYYLDNGLSANDAWLRSNEQIINGDYGLKYQVFNYPSNQMFIGKNGKVNPYATYGRTVNYDGESYYIRPDDWMNETYQSSLRQDYNLSVSSNNESVNFFGSAGYMNNEGIIANSGYERFTGRLAADVKATSWLKIGGDMSYTHYDVESMGSDGTSNYGNPLAFATSLAPIYPMYLRDGAGNIMHNSDGLILYDYGDGKNAGLKRPQGASPNFNGLSGQKYDTRKNTGNWFLGTGYAEIRFLKDFKFTTNNTVYLDESRYTSVSNPYFGTGAERGGSVAKSHSRQTNYTFQQLLNWGHLFGKHNVGILLGHEFNKRRYETLSADKSGMFSPDNHELAGAVVNGSANSYSTEYYNEGWFGRVQYDFDSRYFVDGSYRRDASSRFHKDHRWGNFWSASAGWIISKEAWFRSTAVNLLKLKVSYGENGNDVLRSSYYWTNRYQIVNSNNSPAVTPTSTLGNPKISWEKMGKMNIGLEFGLFNDRLSGSIDGYYNKTTDMLYPAILPSSSGYSNQYDNIGDMMNAGIELDLHGTVFQNRDWMVNLYYNLTWNKNEILRLADSQKKEDVNGHPGYESQGYYFGEGMPMYSYYCYKYAGVDPTNGKALYYKDEKDENGNVIGQTTCYESESPTKYDCGTTVPSVYGGFGSDISFKNFDLHLAFSYSIGGQCYDSDYSNLMKCPTSENIGHAFSPDVLNAWSPENPNSNIPRWQFGDDDKATSDRFLTDASYVTFDKIELGYTLPASALSKLRLQRLRFYVSCDNVYLWAERKGLNPTQSVTGGSTNNYYAPTRTYSAGFTLTF